MRYTKTHEWLEIEEQGIATVGISSRAQKSLGEVIYVDLPKVGEEFEQDDSLGSIESIDGVMHINCPVTGEVIEVNRVLENSPDLINRSPEGDGWIAKIRMESPREFGVFMTPEEYEEYEEEDIDEDEFEDEEEEEYL